MDPRSKASLPLTSGGELGPKRSFWVRGRPVSVSAALGTRGSRADAVGVGRTRGSQADAGGRGRGRPVSVSGAEEICFSNREAEAESQWILAARQVYHLQHLAS